MSTETNARTEALRHALVATATVDGYSRAPRTRKVIVAAIAAFAVAGALTGGAISSAALANPEPPSAQQQRLMVQAAFVLPPNSEFVGSPVSQSGQGNINLDLGAKPKGATGLVVSFWCLDHAKYTTSVDSLTPFSYTCSASKMVSPGITNPDAQLARLATSPKHVWSVSTASSNHWTVWISWAKTPPAPKSSIQQQSEVSDGVVTRQEYLDAFSRFQGCLAEAGYPSLQVLDSSTTFSTGSGGASSDASDRCYVRELQDVNTIWGDMHQPVANGYDPTVMSYCLTQAGQIPAATPDAMLAQLEKLKLNPVDCLPQGK